MTNLSVAGAPDTFVTAQLIGVDSPAVSPEEVADQVIGRLRAQGVIG